MKKINANSLLTTLAHNEVKRKALIKVGDCASCIQTVNDAWLDKEESFSPHNHADGEELYYFLEGEGLMTIDDTEYKVGQSDCILVQKGEYHSLKNLSSKKLRWISVRTKFK
jgi:mannose-6-phosphate isomerase-like protein (cupin superfamily)